MLLKREKKWYTIIGFLCLAFKMMLWLKGAKAVLQSRKRIGVKI